MKRAILGISVLVALAFPCTQATAVPVTPNFDVDVSLQSVTFDGVGFVWKFEVCSAADSNRGLSHWVLSICGDPTVPPWDLTLPDIDYFDLDFFTESGGDYFYTSENSNTYEVEFGTDPTTGVFGIKYEVPGALDLKEGDCDTFEFRLLADFEVIERTWGAKGSTLLDFGLTDGPACFPTDTPGPGPGPGVIPEPATIVLLGLGAMAGGLLRRRRRR